MVGDGWQMGFESINQASELSEIEHNPKISISFFWLERGGRWGLSPLTSPGDHHKLNVMQKWAFYFMPGERWQMGFESIDQPGWSSEGKCNPKMSISFFLAWEGRWMGFESIDQPGWSPEIESNPKIGISFFWLETGGRWCLNPLTSPADHQKLNVIQKWAFHFFGWRGVAHGVWVHRPSQPIIRSWM